jgi:hypothetical protein
MTLFWDASGPLLKYEAGILRLSDLNPHVETRWRMSRSEMFWLGWRCIFAALRRSA